MMDLRYVKLDPTGNITVLVLDPVPRPMQARVAAALMADETVGGEQVGFIEPATIPGAPARLQMMGGEFCGNASMSLAAMLAWEAGGGSRRTMALEVSGCDTPVRCVIETENGVTRGSVSMPLPERVGTAAGYPAVFFPGITHIIAPAADFPDKAGAEAFLCQTARDRNAEAAGLMLWDEKAGTLTPCVYVRATESVVWEHGCASGTAAMGAWLALSRGEGEFSFREPGGTMTARAVTRGERLTALYVSGGVRMADKGTAHIDI